MAALGWLVNLDFAGSALVPKHFVLVAAQSYRDGAVAAESYRDGAAEAETYLDGAWAAQSVPH